MSLDEASRFSRRSVALERGRNEDEEEEENVVVVVIVVGVVEAVGAPSAFVAAVVLMVSA